MARIRRDGRLAWIEGEGTLIVSSDIHGNLLDLLRLIEIFEKEEDACLLFLGDMYHGPYLSPTTWAPFVDHLGEFYFDQSPAVFRVYSEFRRQYPDRTLSLIGNHEHAHIGGPSVAKFTPDEAESFEARLRPSERIDLQMQLCEWPWMAGAACGVAFTHGAPPEQSFTREKVEGESLLWIPSDSWSGLNDGNLLSELLWRRGSNDKSASAFLSSFNQLAGREHQVIVHGHEPAHEGFDIECERVFNLSTSFAMRREKKGYLRLDLNASYQDAAALAQCFVPLYGKRSDPVEGFEEDALTLDGESLFFNDELGLSEDQTPEQVSGPNASVHHTPNAPSIAGEEAQRGDG
ncbi:MAG: hypothetical protein VYD19_11655 [Myxococcota bacterium]|nr:hypothetical protein [Myxococcota bacterium]